MTGNSIMTGNSTDGFAKITYISKQNADSTLKLLKPDKGMMLEEFSPEHHEYTIKLKENEYNINFILETSNPLSWIDKNEYTNLAVPAGKSSHRINVFAPDGTRTQYTINFEREANPANYIEGITVNEKYYKFIDGKYDYKIILPYDEQDIVEISADYVRPSQKIEGLGTFLLKNNMYETNIKVTSEDKNTKTYHVQIVKENSNLIKALEIAGIRLNPEFSPEIEDYNIEIMSSIKELDLSISTYDSSSNITITGNENIPSGQSKIEITVSNPNIAEDKKYTINVTAKDEIVEDYEATGNYEEFIAGFNGKYKIELWGAQGEVGNNKTSFGAYTGGEIHLKKGEKLYVYVGKSGANGGYNGGGVTYTSNRGGGATDIRLVPRNLE
ncbi:MAG: hypothetical protein HFJ51_01800 [Clostridia bacterium]|nr:hypothetical protein [Clostridia bacterium]